VDTAKRTEKVPQAGPKAFYGVAMHFPHAIAVVIPSPLLPRMTHRCVTPAALGNPCIGRRFIGVDGGIGAGLALQQGLDGRLLGIIADDQTNPAGFPSHDTQNRRAVILHSSDAPPFVGPTTRRVGRVSVRRSLLFSILEHLVALHCLIRQKVIGDLFQPHLLEAMTPP